MATNTIAGTDLAAIAEMSLDPLQSLFAPLKGIVTDFSADVSAEGGSVTTRYATKPTAVDLSSGYTSQNTTLTAKTVTLDTFYGFVYGFKDVERSKSAVNLNEIFIAPAVQSLGDKIFGDLWNLVTASNFATSGIITAANFDRSDLADISAVLTATKKAPQMGRTCWLNPTHYASLVKSLNSAEMPGMSREKAEAIVPRTAKFDIYESDIMDANSENLAGFCFHRSALLMAGRRVDSTGAAASGVEVSDLIIPGLEIPIQFRRWYDANAGELKISVGLLYGVAVGVDFGYRITTA